MTKISDNVMELDLREMAIEDCKEELNILIAKLHEEKVSNQTVLNSLNVCLEKLNWKKDSRESNLEIEDFKGSRALLDKLDQDLFKQLLLKFKERIAKWRDRNIDDLVITKIGHNIYNNMYEIDFDDKSGKGITYLRNWKGELTGNICSNNNLCISWDLVKYLIEEIQEK